MGSRKRVKKSARKQAESAKTPAFLRDKHVSIGLKREVEDGLARHLVDNGIAVGSTRYKQLVLRDILPSLKHVNAIRWSAVEPGMINAATQPAVKPLAAHLQNLKKSRTTVTQMVAALEAKDDEPQSSQSSDEEGDEEGEEEEAEADDSDGERAGAKPASASHRQAS